MPVPGRDKYPNNYPPYPPYSGPATTPAAKAPRYEAIRKDLERIDEISYNTKIRIDSLLSVIVGTRPDNGNNTKKDCDIMVSKDNLSLYEFISTVVYNIEENLNSINEQLDRL